MTHLVRSPAALAWVGVVSAMLACQLGGAAQTEDQEQTPAAGSQPIGKSTPTSGGVPMETAEPTSTATLAPTATQAPASGGTAASAQVIAVTSFTSADRVFHVIGVIENNGDLPIWQVKVTFNVLDKAGAVMETVTGYPGYALLFPGERTPFEAGFADPFPREVGDVQVGLEGEAMSFEQIQRNSYLNRHTHACEVVWVEGRPPQFGDYEVLGEVRNTSGHSVTDFGITIMVFDAADNLLAASVHTVPDKYVIGQGLVLAPGETTTFDTKFSNLAPGGEPARMEVGCEGVKTE